MRSLPEQATRGYGHRTGRLLASLLLVWGLLGLVAPSAWACDSGDTGDGASDCDEDGFTADDGDCDDHDPDVHPDASELCDNDIDDDCDGVIDTDCDELLSEGRLEGGSTCERVDGYALLFLVPVAGLRRRSRR